MVADNEMFFDFRKQQTFLFKTVTSFAFSLLFVLAHL